jgi:hypothetical protein
MGVPRGAATISEAGQPANSSEALATEIEAILKAADRAIERQEWSSASGLLKRGLGRLGSSYFSPGTIDDSGMKLLAAEDQERRGHVQNAVRIRHRILSERLRMFQTQLYLRGQ